MDWRKWLCKLGLHRWSKNRCGVRICLHCPAVDRYFGVSGYIRRSMEKRFGLAESDTELRGWWLEHEREANDHDTVLVRGHVLVDDEAREGG